MSQSTSITVEYGVSLHTPEEILKWVDKKISKHTDMATGMDFVTGTSLVSGQPADVYVQAHSKWDFDGVEEFAQKLSAKFPGAPVNVIVEWDNRDADEAGGTSTRYLAGEPAAGREIGWKSSLSDEQIADAIIQRNYPNVEGDDIEMLQQMLNRHEIDADGIRVMLISAAREARS